jgi:GNAT superfamily N-acetyltransferase
MDIDVAPFDPSDEQAIRQAWAIEQDSDQHEFPDIPHDPLEEFELRVRQPPPGHRYERALAFLDGAPAGYIELSMPLLDNLEILTTRLSVRPELRRRGVGRALHTWAVDRARADGRKRLIGQATDRAPGGPAFAAAMGAKPGLHDTRSRLDVTAVDLDGIETMLAEARKHADGYRLEIWQGMPPDAYIDDVAALDGMFIDEAPLGDLEMEPEKVDAARIRSSEQNKLDRGLDRLHAGMVHEATDSMVAWTTLNGTRAVPHHMMQHITLVHPGHRGHRLGLIVKLENLKQALRIRPGLEAIDTWNATSNEHMLAINRAMGFREVDRWVDWQHTIS